jgi:hypothetical protein
MRQTPLGQRSGWILFSAIIGSFLAPPAAHAGAVVNTAPLTRPVVTILRVDHTPKLEDFLEMKPGPNAPAMAKVQNFIEKDPKDGAPAQERTEAYLGYDSRYLYAVFVCFDSNPGRIRGHMARRETIGPDHDEVQLYLDTFNDKRRAYGFMINPRGIQFDYIFTDNDGADGSWDTVWDSWGKVTPQGYVAMMAIPFKSLRFPASGEQTWGIILQRVVPHDNDNSFYPRVSSSIQGRLNQEATLKGLTNISPGRNIQLNPYGIAGAFRVLDQRDPNRPSFLANHFGADAGLDGKMILHDSLVLDFTVNPDFRQLESDQPQNTVNQRFEVFFPEKRTFFQEGANFFSTPINLYFTRRIADPQYGVRLTGKVADKWGLGLLAIDDQSLGRVVPDDDPLRRKRAYFTVGRVTRELWKQSHIGLFYGDREFAAVAPDKTICDDNAVTSTEQISCVTRSNRVGGADFDFKFGDHFRVDGQAVTSTTDQADGTHLAGPAFELYSNYSNRHLLLENRYVDTSPGFVTLTGFFRRPDIRQERTFDRYYWRPEGKIVTDYGPQFFHASTWDHSRLNLDNTFEPGFFMDLKANTHIEYWHGITNEQLRPSDFSTLTSTTNFGKGYNGFFISNGYFKLVQLNGSINFAKAINFDPPANAAPFLADEVNANWTVTVHPWSPLAIDNSYILERLTTRSDPAQAIINAHIIRSKWNYQYNPRLGFRAIFQYNSLLRNPLFTDLDQGKSFNADFLMTYLVHPGTAFYVGYNSNLENLDPLGITRHNGLFRTNRSYINDGRVIFAKISYLFRF